jgi:hypothetical protein
MPTLPPASSTVKSTSVWLSAVSPMAVRARMALYQELESEYVPLLIKPVAAFPV